MNRRIISAAVAGTAVAAVAVVGASPALAATPKPTGSSLAQLQAHGEALIDARLASLQTATTRVQNAKDASAADQQQILAGFAADVSGLTALRAKIAADTDAATAKADDRSIFTTYRIYAVVLPQSHVALGADRLTTTAIPKLQAAHDRLAAKGADATQLAAMQSDIDAATSDVSGLSAAALAVTPADYNSNRTAMTSLRAKLDQAVSSVRQAIAIGRTLAGKGGTATPAPSASGATS